MQCDGLMKEAVPIDALMTDATPQQCDNKAASTDDAPLQPVRLQRDQRHWFGAAEELVQGVPSRHKAACRPAKRPSMLSIN